MARALLEGRCPQVPCALWFPFVKLSFFFFGQCVGVAQVPAQQAAVPLGVASVDASNAYTHLMNQRLDWLLHCFVWRHGVHWSYRVVFGGAWGPACFTDVCAVPRA